MHLRKMCSFTLHSSLHFEASGTIEEGDESLDAPDQRPMMVDEQRNSETVANARRGRKSERTAVVEGRTGTRVDLVPRSSAGPQTPAPE